jgi:hypothetical protein
MIEWWFDLLLMEIESRRGESTRIQHAGIHRTALAIRKDNSLLMQSHSLR